jgi:hypothetical protein
VPYHSDTAATTAPPQLLLKEQCNITVDQSLQQEIAAARDNNYGVSGGGNRGRKREPNVMHENMRLLKASPVRSQPNIQMINSHRTNLNAYNN